MRSSNVRPRHRAAWALGASLVAFGLLAAACGSDDSGSSAGTTAAGGAGTTAGRRCGNDRGFHRDSDAGRQARVRSSRPTREVLGSRRRHSSRSLVTPSSARSTTRSPCHGRRQGRALPRRVDHPERRLHGLDDQGALGHHVPRRHAVRRRRRSSTTSSATERRSSRARSSLTSRRTPTAHRRSSWTPRSDVSADHDEASVGTVPHLPHGRRSATWPARPG